MRKLLAALSLAALATTSARAMEDWQTEYVDLVREEAVVIEAIWPNESSTSFWVSVRDDGTDRSGFADYLCLIVGDVDPPADEFFVISIWDAAAMARDEMVKLGRAECQV